MRILFFGNNWIAWKVAEWLRDEGENLVGLVLHPLGRRKYGEEILAAAGVDSAHVFDGSQLQQQDVIEAIRARRPDLGLSAYFGFILRREILALMPRGAVNLHPAFLPYNRGVFPNVWSIVDGTPAGVTIHHMDERVDTGDIIAQRSVEVAPIDTGMTLYRKIERAALGLFQDTWPLIRSGEAPRTPQNPDEGTYHRLDSTQEIDQIDLDREYTARELIDLIRARTFPPYPGAYFEAEGRKVYLRLQLLHEEDLDEGGA